MASIEILHFPTETTLRSGLFLAAHGFSRRLDILEEGLKLERWRIAAWSFARAVLSAVWEVEDGGDNWEY